MVIQDTTNRLRRHSTMAIIIFVVLSVSSCLSFGPGLLSVPAFAQTVNEIDIVTGSGAAANADCVTTHNCFTPNPLVVLPGTTVTWKNIDVVSHTVTSGKVIDGNSGSLFESGLIKPGNTFQVTFQNSGMYDYFDEIHPWMVGQIIVQTPVQTLTSLQDMVNEMHLKKGVTDSLDDKLQGMIKALTKGNSDGLKEKLTGFIKEVNAQKDNSITTAQSFQLTSAAQAILNIL